MRQTLVLLACVFALLLVASTPLLAELSPTPTANLAPNASPTPTPSPAPEKARAINSPLGDFIPCLFDKRQEHELRALAVPDKLNASASAKVVEDLKARYEAESEQQQADIDVLDSFGLKLATLSLGRTADELHKQLLAIAPNEEIKMMVQQAVPKILPDHTLWAQPLGKDVAGSIRNAVKQEVDEKSQTLRRGLNDLDTLVQTVDKATSDLVGLSPAGAIHELEARQLQALEQKNGASVSSTTRASIDQMTSDAVNNNPPSRFERPDDVSCSFSILLARNERSVRSSRGQ